MRKHQEHHFDNCQTSFLVTVSECIQAALSGVLDCPEKILYQIMGTNLGCVLYSSETYVQIKYGIRWV